MKILLIHCHYRLPGGEDAVFAAERALLEQHGHTVVVYEKDDAIGGLMRYGIPNFKLDKRLIDRRVEQMEAEGTVFRTGVEIGKDISWDDLRSRYDAVVVAIGSTVPRDMKIPGRGLKGIHFAMEFLPDATRRVYGVKPVNDITAEGKHVVIIGGGDTGNDCVGTAIRQGCASVTQLEMMPCPPTERTAANAWPEWPKVLKTDYGQQEAIAVFGSDPRIYQTTVKEFYKDEAGQVCGALIAKLESKVVDEATGRRAMVPTGEEFAIECDLVLIAAGFTGCQPYVAEAFGVDLTKRGTVADTKYATNVPHVFTCGDMRRGQSLVVWALREGRDAAAEVDKSLMGYTNL